MHDHMFDQQHESDDMLALAHAVGVTAHARQIDAIRDVIDARIDAWAARTLDTWLMPQVLEALADPDLRG